jgi:ATP-dependent DNA ligase
MALPRVQPIRPTWRKEPFDAPDWLFDLKYDGFCGMCYIEPDGCRLLSRNGKTFARFETLARQVATELDVSEAILDGEVITADETGRPQFYDLLRRARTPAYVAFDPTVPTCGNYRSASAGSGCKRSCRRVLRSLPGRYQ